LPQLPIASILVKTVKFNRTDTHQTTKKKAIHAEWDNALNREKAGRSRFAQNTLNPDIVSDELQSVCAEKNH
jgi:hypothetical protein